MTVKVNGKEVEIDSTTVEELVSHYQLKPEHVVVEVDEEIIDRSQWKSFELNPGAVVELVHFVGGG